jgi:DNA invertase Pin-like site-specific DNA recombinase
MKTRGVERVFTEKVSGKNLNRPQLKAMMSVLRGGDTVVVESYSRLARNTKDLLTIVENLRDKGVTFVSQKEKLDTSTPQGQLMFTIFAGLAQFERDCTLQRQREGIAIAKEQGKYKGRKPISTPDNWNDIIKLWKTGDITARTAQRKLSLKPATFYRMVAKERI